MSVTILLPRKLVFFGNVFANQVVLIFVQVIVCHVILITKRVKANVKASQCNTKTEDVVISFFGPPVLRRNDTPKFC